MPKNAPIELEMIAMTNKSEHKIEITPTDLTLRNSEDRVVYKFQKFDSLEALSESLTIGAGRIDIYLESKDKLGAGVLEALKAKFPKATASETFVLEKLCAP